MFFYTATALFLCVMGATRWYQIRKGRETEVKGEERQRDDDDGDAKTKNNLFFLSLSPPPHSSRKR